MNKIKKIALYSLFLFSAYSLFADNSYIDYQIEDNTYAVVYVESEQTSAADAKQNALKHAAEQANSNGYRYFTIDAEQKVKVASAASSNQAFHDNMYQELIIERDLGKSSINQESLPNSQIYPGLKVTYSCYKDRPTHGKVMDVCNFVTCD